jgi:hypothetical protein
MFIMSASLRNRYHRKLPTALGDRADRIKVTMPGQGVRSTIRAFVVAASVREFRAEIEMFGSVQFCPPNRWMKLWITTSARATSCANEESYPVCLTIRQNWLID